MKTEIVANTQAKKVTVNAATTKSQHTYIHFMFVFVWEFYVPMFMFWCPGHTVTCAVTNSPQSTLTVCKSGQV